MISYDDVYERTQTDLTKFGKAVLAGAGIVDVETVDHHLTQYPDLWGALFIMPVSNTAATIGAHGEQEHSVLLQLDVCRKVPCGMGNTSKMIGAIIKACPLGTIVTAAGHKVVNAQPSNPRESGGFRRISVTVEFSLRSQRG